MEHRLQLQQQTFAIEHVNPLVRMNNRFLAHHAALRLLLLPSALSLQLQIYKFNVSPCTLHPPRW